MKHRAVIVGSGPNGLSAAIVLARAGLDVEVREAQPLPGGGARSAELTLPGYVHDLCSAVYPMAISSPFFQELPLASHGLRWLCSSAELAHPLDDGTAVMLERDVGATAAQFGPDAQAYSRMFDPLVRHWQTLVRDTFRPLLRIPPHPFLLGRFGLQAIQPTAVLARNSFRGERARALFAGISAHSFLRLESPLSASFGLMLTAAGHALGWPIPQGGSQQITQALIDVLASYGGRVVTGSRVNRLIDLGKPDLALCDVTPHQFLQMADLDANLPYRRLLEQWRYGPGVFKVDWALSEPIPWKAKECLRATTVHLGGTLDEIAASERASWNGDAPEKPFILLVQPTLIDPTRAPPGRHTVWAYCHVPNGWQGSALRQMEAQVERFAPGFRDCILAGSVHGPAAVQAQNENLIGGDIIGGATDLKQFVLRPTWRTYGTPLKGVYLCGSSTPPGGSVHGMCGYNAATRALRWLKRNSKN